MSVGVIRAESRSRQERFKLLHKVVSEMQHHVTHGEAAFVTKDLWGWNVSYGAAETLDRPLSPLDPSLCHGSENKNVPTCFTSNTRAACHRMSMWLYGCCLRKTCLWASRRRFRQFCGPTCAESDGIYPTWQTCSIIVWMLIQRCYCFSVLIFISVLYFFFLQFAYL